MNFHGVHRLKLSIFAIKAYHVLSNFIMVIFLYNKKGNLFVFDKIYT